MPDYASDLTLYSPLELRRKVGAQAKSLRVALGQTQTELARRAGIGRSTLIRFERGEDVSFTVVIAVAMALDSHAGLREIFKEKELRSFDELVREASASGRRRR
jgi:transcriptional regulator with XRE-family HTH domain